MFLFFVFVLFSFVSVFPVYGRSCSSLYDCGECIIAGCLWCPELVDRPKCFGETEADDIVCSNALYFENELEVTLDKDDGDPETQMRPQALNLNLVGGSSQVVGFSLNLLEQQPVDLYYLIDTTEFKSKSASSLRRFGQKLLSTVQKLTNDYRIGLGIIGPSDEKSSCLFGPCEESIGLINLLSLTNDTHEFSEILSRLQIPSHNRQGETQEVELLDALMQVIACPDFEWRRGARHFLVLSTKTVADFTERESDRMERPPYGVQCLPSLRGFYDLRSSPVHFAFPMVNYKAKRRDISLVVAVPSRVLNKGGARNESEHAVEIVKNRFQRTWSRIDMIHNATDGVTVEFFTNCNTMDPSYYLESGLPVSTCQNVNLGSTTRFLALVKTPNCTTDNYEQLFHIHPYGLSTKLSIYMNVFCRCPADIAEEPNTDLPLTEGTTTRPSTTTSSRIFGFPGFFDPFGTTTSTAARPTVTTSRPSTTTTSFWNFPGFVTPDSRTSTTTSSSGIFTFPNFFNPQPSTKDSRETTQETTTMSYGCSGNGELVEGRCQCYDGYSGKNCECTNNDCPMRLGVLCSGHGRCECGRCACDPEWTQDDCSCTNNVTTCTNPATGDICSGVGDCVCGECICPFDYYGTFCNLCTTCNENLDDVNEINECDAYKDCVQCSMYKKGRYSAEECASQCQLGMLSETSEGIQQLKNDNNYVVCEFIDDDDCKFSFAYRRNDITVKVQDELNCPAKSWFEWF